jgi:hypothetical protein
MWNVHPNSVVKHDGDKAVAKKRKECGAVSG